MTHPLIKLWQDCQDPAGLGVPYPANQDLARLIEYAKSQHLIITVTPDTDAKRAALLKAREELDIEIAALALVPPVAIPPAPIKPPLVLEQALRKLQHDYQVGVYVGLHDVTPKNGEPIGEYHNGTTIRFGDY